MHHTIERYNIVNRFLNTFLDHDAKEFAEHLILQILPTLPTDDLCEIDALLTYVDKAVKEIAGKPDSFDKAKLT